MHALIVRLRCCQSIKLLCLATTPCANIMANTHKPQAVPALSMPLTSPRAVVSCCCCRQVCCHALRLISQAHGVHATVVPQVERATVHQGCRQGSVHGQSSQRPPEGGSREACGIHSAGAGSTCIQQRWCAAISTLQEARRSMSDSADIIVTRAAVEQHASHKHLCRWLLQPMSAVAMYDRHYYIH
jgi:hypothetical protein